MPTLTGTTPSGNPNLSTPNASGTSSGRTAGNPSSATSTSDNGVTQPHLAPPSVTISFPPPDETRRIPPERDLDGIPLEEPPPYTPSPAFNSGETTIEHGPSRPF